MSVRRARKRRGCIRSREEVAIYERRDSRSSPIEPSRLRVLDSLGRDIGLVGELMEEGFIVQLSAGGELLVSYDLVDKVGVFFIQLKAM